MTSDQSVLATRIVGGSSDGQYATLRSNELGHQLVSGGLPPYTEMVRRGDRWKVTTATPFTPLVVLPTTLAALEVKNNRFGYVMVIDTIFSWQLLGTAVVETHTPWAQVGAAVVSANTALVEYSANGKDSVISALATEAVCAINQTVVANGWEVFPGSSMNFGLAAATPGGANVGQVDGRLVVPYGKSVHVHCTSSVATASSKHVGVTWYWATITNQT